MVRIINVESAGKDRNNLVKGIVISIRELVKQSQFDDKSRDLAAHISLSLLEIYQTIEVSVAAWEKRGYWVKADRFRMEWDWTSKLGVDMRQAVFDNNWQEIGLITVKVAQKFNNVRVPARGTSNQSWLGAWQRLQSVK